MICPRCAADNSDRRSYCRECGALGVFFCSQCGFRNSQTDRYCGGCGRSVAADQNQPPAPEDRQIQTPALSGRFSSDDLADLFGRRSAPRKTKRPEVQESAEVSQDLLDSIFDSQDSD